MNWVAWKQFEHGLQADDLSDFIVDNTYISCFVNTLRICSLKIAFKMIEKYAFTFI